ncbi:MAG: type II secretion system F family protein [Armatimonadetes bacterium]|nr:type II secretion system F family protein [Armatimonadota bacterium]
MATFVYNAVDAMGKTIQGRIDAENEQLVLDKLHEQRFHVLSVQQQKQRSSAAMNNMFARFQKIKLQSMVVFSRQFATMINAGISILKCLDILEAQTKDPVLKPVIGAVKRDVKGGSSLADALQKHPSIFNKLYVNMIKAAEAGGILDEILDRLSSFLESEMEIRQKIKSAMIYPVMVLVFSVLMVFALFMFVLPKFKEIFISMNVEMPGATKILFDSSAILQKFWFVPLILVVGTVAGIKQAGKRPKGRFWIDNFKLKFPIIGDLVLKMSISRFARTLGTLVSSGVPMMRSLEIVAETSGNTVIAGAIDSARISIREGQKISAPLETSGLFPSMVTHMIDVGEETGRLSDMLIKVSDFYDKEVDAAVKALTSLIEPMLIIFMGTVVGFIAISVMSPIFKLVSSIS